MKKIEFKREGDDLIYSFNLDGEYNGKVEYRREDKSVSIVFLDNIGWCLLDIDKNIVSLPFFHNRNIRANRKKSVLI